ncbi:MAG TPA: hypothetical protein VGJ32_16750, partial [Solirubrobacteraceae bacterium]
MPRALLIALTLLAALPAPAGARVLVVGTGTNMVALVDVATGGLAAQLDAGAPTGAVAVAPNGRTAWVAAGTQVVGIDPNARALGARTDLGAGVGGLAVSPRGGRVYAVTGDRLAVLDATTLARLRTIRLHGDAVGPLGVSRDGTLAAVPLARSRVALVALGAMRTLRRVKVRRAAGAAFDARGLLWVAATNARLYPVHPYVKRKPVGRPLHLGRGVGGAVAASPDGRRLLVGAAARAPRAALVDPFGRRVHGLRAGAGPGRPGWSPDGIRAYLADAAAGELSVVSPLRGSRLGAIGLPPGWLPGGVVVQPGLATVPGTTADDRLLGTRLRDLLEGYAGNDTLEGRRDNDVLHGDDGDDTELGGSYDDRLLGGPGADQLFGGSGNDRLEGGDDGDLENGGTGDDSVHGGAGNDVLDGGDGDDHIFGEAG